jgi:hypothetical protein
MHRSVKPQIHGRFRTSLRNLIAFSVPAGGFARGGTARYTRDYPFSVSFDNQRLAWTRVNESESDLMRIDNFR